MTAPSPTGDTSEPTDATAPADTTDTSGSAETSEQVMRRKFQEALARKHDGAGGGAPGSGAQGRGVGPSAGAKTQRQFRRKSG